MSIGFLGGLGSLAGGVFGAMAADRAGDAAAAAANAARRLQRRMWETGRQDIAPWRETGTQAIGYLGNLAGLNGAGNRQAAFDQFQASPDYQFRMRQGIDAADQSAASRGMLMSGAQQKALAGYGSDLASQEFGNYWNRMAGLAGVGQTAAMGGAQMGQNYANQAGQLGLAGAQARGSSYITGANAINQGIQGGLTGLAYGMGSGGFPNWLNQG